MLKNLEIIGIDEGHGGPDEEDGQSFEGGAYMTPDASEDDWTLEFGQLLGKKLTVAGFRVAHSRVHDVLLTREQRRMALANCDLILSIHVNRLNIAPTASGLITFRWPGNRLSLAACEQIHRFVPHALRRTGNRDFAVSRHDWTSRAYRVVSTFAPSCVLIEAGFASNVRDLRYLTSDTGKEALAVGLVAAMSALRNGKAA